MQVQSRQFLDEFQRLVLQLYEAGDSSPESKSW